jgi:predicted Zn-dependent peptidase
MSAGRFREFASRLTQPGVRLLALRSERFKTVSARICLLEPIRPVVATRTALMARVMARGSSGFPSRREIARALEELYGAALSFAVTRFADTHALIVSAEFPADRYLGGARILPRALSLLTDVLLRPLTNADGDSPREEVFEQERAQLGAELSALRDDKPSWAALRASRHIYSGTPAAVPETGEAADLPGITGGQLIERHRQLLRHARVMAFLSGPVDEERALKALERALTLPVSRRAALPAAVRLSPAPRVRRARESAVTEQTHLHFAWTGGAPYGARGYAAALVADAMVGGTGLSRLFKVVREQHGLAYAVGSQYHRARGVLLASAAVDPGKADRAAALIRREVQRLQRAGFSEAEFTAARESLIQAQRAALDSPGARGMDLVFQSVLGFRRSPELIEKDLSRVTPEQARAALRALCPHSEFRYGPARGT